MHLAGGRPPGVFPLPSRRGDDTTGPVTVVTDELVRELHVMLTALVRRAPLFADLRERGLADDLVQDTILAVTQHINAGNAVDEPFSYATACVRNLAKRTFLRVAREPAIGGEAVELLAPLEEDVADRVVRREAVSDILAMVRSVNGVITDLEPLALELVRAEVARADHKQLATRLGMSRPTLYRRKGPAILAFVAAVAARAGTTPCPEYAGSLLAAAGASGFSGARDAIAHAEDCPECGETIRHLTVARHGLALIAPIPLLTVRAADHDPAGVLSRLHAAGDGALDWLRNMALRVGDPTPLGGSAATKTVAVVAAACTGGGGIYCAVDGVPGPLKAPFAHHGGPRRPAGASAGSGASPTAPRVLPTRFVVASSSLTPFGRVSAAREQADRRAAQEAASRRARSGGASGAEFAGNAAGGHAAREFVHHQRRAAGTPDHGEFGRRTEFGAAATGRRPAGTASAKAPSRVTTTAAPRPVTPMQPAPPRTESGQVVREFGGP